MGWQFSGFIAWFLWRAIYLSKLPRFEKKVRVALDWALDLIFTKDLVQFVTDRAPHVSHAAAVNGEPAGLTATVPGEAQSVMPLPRLAAAYHVEQEWLRKSRLF